MRGNICEIDAEKSPESNLPLFTPLLLNAL